MVRECVKSKRLVRECVFLKLSRSVTSGKGLALRVGYRALSIVISIISYNHIYVYRREGGGMRGMGGRPRQALSSLSDCGTSARRR